MHSEICTPYASQEAGGPICATLPYGSADATAKLPIELKQAILDELGLDDFLRTSQANRAWFHASASVHIQTRQLARACAGPCALLVPKSGPACGLRQTLIKAQQAQAPHSRAPQRLHMEIARMGCISALAFSSDHKVMTASESSQVIVYDLKRPYLREVKLTALYGGVREAVSTPNGRRAVVLSEDESVTVWEPETQMRKRLGAQNTSLLTNAIDVSPNGNSVLLGMQSGDVHLYNYMHSATEPLVLHAHASAVSCVAFSPCGQWIATASTKGTARIWRTQAPLACVAELRGHKGGIVSLSFSSNARRLATASEDGRVLVWDWQSAQAGPQVLCGHQSRVHTVVFSRDATLVASASEDNAAHLWDLRAQPARRITLEGHTGRVNCISFGPSRRFVVTGSEDGQTRVWDLAAVETAYVMLQPFAHAVTCAGFSANGRFVGTASQGGTVRIMEYDAAVSFGSGTNPPNDSMR